jgi:hypothetical protein
MKFFDILGMVRALFHGERKAQDGSRQAHNKNMAAGKLFGVCIVLCRRF